MKNVSQELIQSGIFKFNDEYYTQKQGLPIRFIDDISIADLIEIDLDELLSQRIDSLFRFNY
ncbi:hypothetical protein BpHYR1_024550 [Brachionus plicatilis]|uniref:Uncharacterized protein n=1 Tax=Brachionus plicatilis TaxID=10195 RepID=A0A3M7RDI3_BRAPC|nr:hypothetical protein BpHYR1_024550 [Brachionus plicatilis]